MRADVESSAWCCPFSAGFCGVIATDIGRACTYGIPGIDYRRVDYFFCLPVISYHRTA